MKARFPKTQKLLAVAAVTAVVAAHAAPALADPTPPPDDKAPRVLLALRAELQSTTEANALAQMAHFRPLCDERGYPLVGNAHNGKGPSYQPSAFCASVRKAKAGS